MQAELVLDARHGVGESPVWIAAEQALHWVDIPGRGIFRWHAPTARVTSWSTEEMPACIAPHVAGGWVCGMESGVFHLQLPQGEGKAQARRIAAVQHAEAGMRFNDGRCDRQGRLRAGTMVMDMSLARAAGQVYALDEGPSLRALVPGLITPNGMAFSPDGRTMYLSDSHPDSQQVWAFDYDLDGGTPTNHRLFIDMRPLPGRPDGAAVDEDGCYWVCGNDAGLVHRFTPRGQLDRSLPVPVKKPAMCAFGGAGLDTLFVTSIRPGGDLSDQPLAGGVFALRPGVRGLPEPACRLPL
ncbi:SMP-30/gluconolactonase/LRE family protein [Ramlibacter humi]|uniref:SMP-30/gluconolactonase/LRE family protein n=1 Tax=Ramlibacter humi TaxID=2530451 RepID=A0A4Z0BHG4_9BURK|nr:SMP-30/gluconolactonase/LRE family protein [Ramlibacter humi]TFY97707.1 SMP-30/gluconolactonase/LRE family protein [Ramlibacter humi]